MSSMEILRKHLELSDALVAKAKGLSADFHRAAENAKAVLKVGDQVSVRHGKQSRRCFTFMGWDGDWMFDRGGTDHMPFSVVAVNGKPVDFRTEVKA